MALIGETELGGKAGEVLLAACNSFERGSRTKTHAVARDRVACSQMEDAAEVVGRDRKLACESRQRTAGFRRHELTGSVDEETARARRRRSSGRNALWVDLLESRSDKEIARSTSCSRSAPLRPAASRSRWTRSTCGVTGTGPEGSFSPPQSDAASPGSSAIAVHSSPSCVGGWSKRSSSPGFMQ
jgi:hypothetical protein